MGWSYCMESNAGSFMGSCGHGLLCLLAFVMFWVFFGISWNLSRGSEMFKALELHQKADWCSRINSTFHALLIVPAMLLLTWDDTPTDTTYLIPLFFCVTVGYFTMDLIVLLVYQVPYWSQFAIHHVVAVVPYAVYLLSSHCQYGVDILALFLCVEVSTLPLNAQAFLEQTGLGDTMAHTLAFYFTYFTWLVFRVCLPLILMYVLWSKYILGPDPLGCMLPGIVCSHIITFFCIFIFVVVLTPDLRERYKRNKTAVPVAPEKPAFEPIKIPTGTPTRPEGRPLLRESVPPSSAMTAQIWSWENSVRAEIMGGPPSVPEHLLYDSAYMR
jgi:hypothetical protein